MLAHPAINTAHGTRNPKEKRWRFVHRFRLVVHCAFCMGGPLRTDGCPWVVNLHDARGVHQCLKYPRQSGSITAGLRPSRSAGSETGVHMDVGNLCPSSARSVCRAATVREREAKPLPYGRGSTHATCAARLCPLAQKK